MPVEFHCHSTASDGALTPTELIERALALGLTALALTDHDTVDGLEEAFQAAKETSLRVISGVELSCVFEGHEIHLLGYFFEHRDPTLLELLEELKVERRNRAQRMVEKLNAAGIALSYEEVEAESPGLVLGRPHVAKALVKRGVVDSVNEAFQRFIGLHGPAYVGRSLLSLPAGIEAIRRSGGCSVLAHPGLLKDWALVERILKLEIDGVEYWHPSHSKQARKRAKKLGGKYNKVLTGGSDFHRPMGESVELGTAPVTEKVVARLFRAAGGGLGDR